MNAHRHDDLDTPELLLGALYGLSLMGSVAFFAALAV